MLQKTINMVIGPRAGHSCKDGEDDEDGLTIGNREFGNHREVLKRIYGSGHQGHKLGNYMVLYINYMNILENDQMYELI
jgi:hypothetical protein